MAKPIVIADLRGGRNGADPPLSLPENQCVEALNVDWYDGMIGRKRPGADSVSLTGGTAFTGPMNTLARHVPAADETAAEFWGIDAAATPLVKRLTGGTSWADISLDDAIATRPQDAVPVSLNGKLFWFYDSSVDRPHVYDPTLASPRIRRMGFVDPTTGPTVADQGAGAYAAVIRYYRIRWLQLSGPVVIRRSEPSNSQSFTPDGAHGSARVTRPTAAGEGETHWEIEASTNNVTFYRLSQVVIATTTYDDSAATTTYSANTLSDVVGTYSPPTSGKYAMTDGNRILFAGAWESGGKNSRVWFTPVLGSSDQGDDERVPNTTTQKNFVDLNENDGGGVTGCGGPLFGSPYTFKYREIIKLVPTGDVNVPYIPRKLFDSIGCVNHKTIVVADDETGAPALYFLSHKGPYRIGSNGLQYLGRDNEDIWKTMNLGATNTVAHAVAHPDIHQVWFWVATSANNDPDTKMVFDTLLGHPDDQNRVRGGWAKHTGNTAGARCSALFSNTLGASMSRDLKPHIGRSTGTTILKCDSSSATDDAGTTFQAYVKMRPILPAGNFGQNFGIGQTTILAKSASGVTITQTIDKDFGVESPTSTALLTPAASETRVIREFEGSQMSGAGSIQIQLGDGSAVSNSWTLDALCIPVTGQEAR